MAHVLESLYLLALIGAFAAIAAGCGWALYRLIQGPR